MKRILFILIIFANIFYNMATGKDGGGEPSQRKGKRPLLENESPPADQSRRTKGKFTADGELSKAAAGGFINFDETEEPTEIISSQKKPKQQRIFRQKTTEIIKTNPADYKEMRKAMKKIDENLYKLDKKYDRLEKELRNIHKYEIQNADYLTEEEQKRIDENKNNLNIEKTELEKQIADMEKERQQIIEQIQANDTIAIGQDSSSLETGNYAPVDDNQKIVRRQNPLQTRNPHQQQMQSSNSFHHYLQEQEQRLGQEIAARIDQGSSASAFGIVGHHQQIQGHHQLPQFSVDQKQHMKGKTNLSHPSQNMSHSALNKLNKKYVRLENELKNIHIYESQNADYLTEGEKKKIDENKAEIQAKIAIMANEKQQMMAGKKQH